MSNLIDIQHQIEKLQKQASEIKSKEFGKTVQQIRAMMAAFGITLSDLKEPKRAGRVRKTTTKSRGKAQGKSKAVVAKKPASKSRKKTGVTVAPKFRGPNGETWSGRGLTPKWLAALLAQGRKKDDFAIKA